MTTGDARQYGYVVAATEDLEPDGESETRDSDGTPVGEADLEADKERAGAEPDNEGAEPDQEHAGAVHEHHHRHDV